MRVRIAAMQAPPKLSIIVPVYATEPYLGRCLESLLEQTLGDIEILVVNDCSPDGSESMVRQFVARDSRVHLTSHTHNQGLGAARNTGLGLARGQFVGSVDSDDFVRPDTFAHAIERCEADRTDVAMFSALDYVEDEQRTSPRGLYDLRRYPRCLDVSPADLVALPPTFQIKIYRRALFEQIGARFSPGLHHEDVEFFWKFFGSALPRVSVIHEPLYFHRKRKDRSSIMDNSRRTRKDLPTCLLNAMRFLVANGRFPAVRSSFIERVTRALYVIGHVQGDYRAETYAAMKLLITELDPRRSELPSDLIAEEFGVISTGSLWDYLNWRLETESRRRDAAVERAVEALRASRSWRLTEPLRRLIRLTRRG
jgi:GT2 family glycosyltransferase